MPQCRGFPERDGLQSLLHAVPASGHRSGDFAEMAPKGARYRWHAPEEHVFWQSVGILLVFTERLMFFSIPPVIRHHPNTSSPTKSIN